MQYQNAHVVKILDDLFVVFLVDEERHIITTRYFSSLADARAAAELAFELVSRPVATDINVDDFVVDIETAIREQLEGEKVLQ